MHTIFTIGHSNHTIDELIDLLRQYQIPVLIDIRSHPASARYPQFTGDTLRASLEASGILYHWAGRQLGGVREPDSGDDSVSRHSALPEGLRAFANYMSTDSFIRAVTQLMNMAMKSSLAIMCAERDPMHCHRSLISDYLLLQGIAVTHVLSADGSREHQLRDGARRESAELVYDRNSTVQLGF